MKLSYTFAILALVGATYALPADPAKQAANDIQEKVNTESAQAHTSNAADAAHTAAEETAAAAKDAANAGAAKASNLKENVAAGASNLKENVAAGAEKVKQSAKATGSKVANEGKKIGQRTTEAYNQATEAVANGFKFGYNSLKGQEDWQQNGTLPLVKKVAPATLAAVGLVLGAFEGHKALAKHRASPIKVKVN